MKASESFAEQMMGEACASSSQEAPLPYDIRAEIDWTDFSCIANPLGTPEHVRAAIARAIAEGDLSFAPDGSGAHLSRMIGRYFEVPEQAIMVGTSATQLIASIAQAFRPCGVGIPVPAPSGYFLAIANAGHNPVKVSNPFSTAPLEPHTAYRCAARFDAAVLANPSFPCARLLSEKTLEGYLEACSWVIVDESSIDLALGGESFVPLTQRYDNLFVVRSLSLALGMPGVPMGYAVGSPDAVAQVSRFLDGSEITLFNEVVAREFPRTEGYRERTAALLEREIPWMQCMLGLTPGIKAYPSEANFVMCALEERSARDFGIGTAAELVVRLQKAGFGVRDLTGTPGIDDARSFSVAVRTREENERFIKALRSVIGA